jgi:DNA-binding transcriptional LysR family regulator
MANIIENLEDLLVFVQVVESKSFSAVALASGKTKSAISKQVKRLEQALGTKLLNRTTRHLSLTETGNAVYERGVRIAEEAEGIKTAVDDLQNKPSGILRITTSVAFGNMHLTKLVSEFIGMYPGVRVSLTLSDRYIDVVEEGFDIAIRLTSKPIESFVARRLSSLNYVVCATPEYLSRHDQVKSLEDLTNHDCLLYAHRPQSEVWTFVKDGKSSSVKVDGKFTVNSSESLRIAALNGLGIALLPTFAVGEDLKSGRLTALLQEYAVEGAFGNNIYAIFIPNKFLSPKVRVFIDFLVLRFENGGCWDS